METVKNDTEIVVKDGGDPAKEGKTPLEESAKETTDVKKTEDTKDDDLDGKKAESQVTASEDRIQAILDKFGYDSLEDLEEDFDDYQELRETIGDKDAKQLVEDAEYLKTVKQYWKDQEETKKREAETADETIERLEKEKKEALKNLDDHKSKEAEKKEKENQRKQAEKLIQSFNSTVGAEIDKIKDLPKEYKPFLEEYLGVNNPANEINIGSKPEIRNMSKALIKKFFDFEQVVIKRYLDGKVVIPKIDGSSETPVTKETKPKNLKEARSQLFHMFGIKR